MNDATDPERLHRYAEEIGTRIGLPPDDAERLADYFVWVELHGLPLLGGRRIPEFVARVREGGTRAAGVAAWALGYFAMLAVRAKMIGLVINNAPG